MKNFLMKSSGPAHLLTDRYSDILQTEPEILFLPKSVASALLPNDSDQWDSSSLTLPPPKRRSPVGHFLYGCRKRECYVSGLCEGWKSKVSVREIQKYCLLRPLFHSWYWLFVLYPPPRRPVPDNLIRGL